MTTHRSPSSRIVATPQVIYGVAWECQNKRCHGRHMGPRPAHCGFCKGTKIKRVWLTRDADVDVPR